MSKCLLSVDDSSTMRKMIAFTLQGLDLEILEAEDGLQALEAVKGRKIDLVITDVNMPHMDGLTLVGHLRALPGFKFTPILMLTTESDKDIKQKGKQAGATGWLVKPFSPEALVEVVKKFI